MEELNMLNLRQLKIKEKAKKTIVLFFIGFLLFLIIILDIILYMYNNYFKNKILTRINNLELIFSQNIKISQNESQIKFKKDTLNISQFSFNNNSNNYLVLLPGNNCQNKKLRTLYFPRNNHVRKYDKPNNSFDTNNSRIIPFNYYYQTFYTETQNEIREDFLKKLGLKLNETFGVHSLYITPYLINETYENKIKKNLVNRYQKINRFFNYYDYVSKSSLYKNYKKMKTLFQDDFDYMFETYSYPEDKIIIFNKFKNYRLTNYSQNELWLIKPKLSTCGANIALLKEYSDIKDDYIITKFLKNPHLIKGFKYDLRFHGLITSILPLKLYLYNEGLVRISSEKYDYNNLTKLSSYLTNIALNIKNEKKYIYPNNISNIEDSNLWNFDVFQNYCEKKGYNYTEIFEKVKDIFIKLVLSIRKKTINYIKKINLHSSNFYHLIGFDIILDNNLKPYLLETNRRTSLRNDNEAEKYNAYNMIADTLNLIGLRIINKNYNTFYNYAEYEDNFKEEIEDSLCELERPRGGYILIFPLKNNIEKYKKFYLDEIPKEDEELWKKIKE